MKRIFLATAALALTVPVSVMAASGPGCGWGTQVWKGKTGLFAHTSAGTTNGTLFNQSFGISSGTAGCKKDATVNNEYQQRVFVAANFDELASDVAQGAGDHLSSLASLIGIEGKDRPAFYRLTQANFGEMFSAADADQDSVLGALHVAMRGDPVLVKYAH